MSVKEADGTVSRFIVPYSSVPNMVQPGVAKYDFAAGRSRIEGASQQTDFLQGTYQYGVNNLLTLYGGTMLASDYRSFTLGTGWNTLIGAVSVDGTLSHSKQDNGDVFDGKATRLPGINISHNQPLIFLWQRIATHHVIIALLTIMSGLIIGTTIVAMMTIFMILQIIMRMTLGVKIPSLSILIRRCPMGGDILLPALCGATIGGVAAQERIIS